MNSSIGIGLRWQFLYSVLHNRRIANSTLIRLRLIFEWNDQQGVNATTALLGSYTLICQKNQT